MSDKRDWKTVFLTAMYECAELRQKKVHRDLLVFILHKAHSKTKQCWVSQKEMARVQGCSVRNTKDLLRDLQGIGALLQVRFSALPSQDKDRINSLSPLEMKGTSNVYYLSMGWATEVLDGGRTENPRGGDIGITPADRTRGRQKSNERRRRYAPIDLSAAAPVAADQDHDDYLFLNAVEAKGGSPTTPIQTEKGGSPTTDISTEDNQAGNSAPNNGHDDSARFPSSQAKSSSTYRSSLTSQHDETDQHGYGAGEACALGQGTKFLAGLGGAHESTEYDAARARAADRRVS